MALIMCVWSLKATHNWICCFSIPLTHTPWNWHQLLTSLPFTNPSTHMLTITHSKWFWEVLIRYTPHEVNCTPVPHTPIHWTQGWGQVTFSTRITLRRGWWLDYQHITRSTDTMWPSQNLCHGYRTFGKLAKSILYSFSSTCPKNSPFLSKLLQNIK